jgi:hypothetical protein
MGGNKNVPPFVHGQSMVPENAVISTSSLANLPSWFVGCKFYAVWPTYHCSRLGPKCKFPDSSIPTLQSHVLFGFMD